MYFQLIFLALLGSQKTVKSVSILFLPVVHSQFEGCRSSKFFWEMQTEKPKISKSLKNQVPYKTLYKFENAYPSLFCDISKQVRATLSDQSVIAIVISDFSAALFRDGRITWFSIGYRYFNLIFKRPIPAFFTTPIKFKILRPCYEQIYFHLIHVLWRFPRTKFVKRAVSWIKEPFHGAQLIGPYEGARLARKFFQNKV